MKRICAHCNEEIKIFCRIDKGELYHPECHLKLEKDTEETRLKRMLSAFVGLPQEVAEEILLDEDGTYDNDLTKPWVLMTYGDEGELEVYGFDIKNHMIAHMETVAREMLVDETGTQCLVRYIFHRGKLRYAYGKTEETLRIKVILD